MHHSFRRIVPPIHPPFHVVSDGTSDNIIAFTQTAEPKAHLKNKKSIKQFYFDKGKLCQLQARVDIRVAAPRGLDKGRCHIKNMSQLERVDVLTGEIRERINS